MRMWTKFLVPVLALGLVGVADAAKGGKKDGKGVKGVIESVDATAHTLTVKAGGKKAAGASKTLKIGDTATISVDGTAGKALSDLTAGEHVIITASGDTASDIKAVTKASKKGAKKAK